MPVQTATSNIGWQNKFSTTLTSGITSTDTTIPLNALPSPSEGFLVIEPDSATNWEVIYYTSKTGSGVVCTSAANGRGVDDSTAIAHSQGATVRMDSTAGMFEVLQNGSAIPTGTITAKQLASSSELIPFNFVASGCVWSGDAYASTLNGSMTSGVVYINGVRLTAAVITAHAFTASKDTYVDFQDNADGTAHVYYTEVANNAASPALANSGTTANTIRVAIIVSGAGNIAAATSVNQGQETMVLPIASSIPYAVTDSLGNLICPRDPNRRILGYRQIISNFAPGTTTETAVTGLSVPVIVPTGRKVRVKSLFIAVTGSTGVIVCACYDGTTVGGTKVAQSQATGSNNFIIAETSTTPTSASKNYIASIVSTIGNPTLLAGPTNPSFIMVELV